jgi:hypothetical protein
MADESTATPRKFGLKPPFARTMPWALIVLAIALAVYAGVAQRHTTVTSRVTAPASAQPSSAPTTITEKTPSDEFVGALFALAALVALAGAFYGRISKISLPGGGGLEMGALAIDLDAIVKAVVDEVRKLVAKTPTEELDWERVAQGLQDALAQASQTALALRAAAAPVATAPPLAVQAKELQRVQQGMPLSDDLVRRLAVKAVRDVFGEVADDDGASSVSS